MNTHTHTASYSPLKNFDRDSHAEARFGGEKLDRMQNWSAASREEFGTLGRNSTPRANGQRRLVCASLSTGISLFAPSSLFSIPRADIDPTTGCPLITLYHACTCRFLAHGRQNIILVSNMMHDFRSRNYASRFQDGIFFISPRCEYRVVSNPNRA